MQHPVRIDAGEAEGDEPRARLEPEPRRSGLGGDEQRCGAVADLGRVACSDLAVRRKRASARRAPRPTCRAAASRRPRPAHRRVDSSPRPGRSRSRSAPRRSPRPRAGATRARTRRAAPARSPIRPRPPPRRSLRHDLPPLEQLVGEVAAVRAHRDARHHLDAFRHDDVELSDQIAAAALKFMHRRAALAVDRRPADGLGPAATSGAMRPMFQPCSPICVTQPSCTSSTSAGSSSCRPTSAFST